MTGTISNTTINTALEAGTNVTISTTAGAGGNGHLVQNADAPITKTKGGDASLTLIADLDLGLNGGISSIAGKLNVSLSASGASGGANSGAIVVRSDISTNGGDLSFLSGTYVAGTNGATPTNFRTAGGKVDFRGDVLIANTNGLNIDTATGSAGGAGGGVTFAGNVDSADAYEFRAEVVDWNAAAKNAQGKTNGEAAVGDSYLATPLSAFQNLVAGNAAGFKAAWLGGTAGGLNGTNWYWAFGPKKGLVFNLTRTGSAPAQGVYTNWYSGADFIEPNNLGGEYVLQFVGRQGNWNDRAPDNLVNSNGYVVQTNLAASPLTINAGGANVVFNGRVGSLKPLDSLTVTGPTAINGGQVTTEKGQKYNSSVTIGNVASTLLESTKSTLQLDSAITYSGTTGSVLTARANQDVEVNAPIRATGTGALTVNVSADTTGTVNGDVTHTGTGAIRQNAAIQSNGGGISLTASSGITGKGAALSASGGNITLTNSTRDNIALSDGSTLNAGAGNITVTNAPTKGGTIALQDLTGGAITVANRATDLLAGTDAVTLNGPVTATVNGPVTTTGAVLVTANTGDVQVNQNITSDAKNNAAAVVVAAGTDKKATDATGGNVKFTGGKKIVVDSTSRGIVYTGSLDGTTGVGAA
ncbi:beta strand repeat-containing protein, partial [Burkholderia ubonensis]|uniref:beta strand repeat-containing protein n=1 Tax=Burkholderia ubonensis TaxID=101571 RepID=UPI001E2C425F